VRKSRHVDDILGIIDRLFGPEDEEPPPRVRTMVRTRWWCSADGIIDDVPSDLHRPRCDECGVLMEPYQESKDDPTGRRRDWSM
jgi:hypothetical protein